MLEGGKINHFVVLLCDGFCGEYITLYYRIVLNFQLIAESGGQLCLTKKQGVHAMKYNMINIKNTFKVDSDFNHFMKITVMIFLMLFAFLEQSAFAQEKSAKVKLRYSKGRASSVNLYCKGHNNWNSCNNIIKFSDSIDAPSSNLGDGDIPWCGKYTYRLISGNSVSPHFSNCIEQDVFKHTFSDGSVMYSTSSDPNHFNNREVGYIELDVMDLLKAMPEIGISRVDPNLIEY